jgi:chloramphenicol 3-O-phosphotransferase
VLLDRARARALKGGPPAGLSKRYVDRVHDGATYDLQIDTSMLSTRAAAELVADRLHAGRRDPGAVHDR